MPNAPMTMGEGFHVDHWGNLIGVSYFDLRHPSSRTSIPLLVKGCRHEHSIENGHDLQISTPKTFRDQGESLIRDPEEGYVSKSTVSCETENDARDLEWERQRNEALNRTAELVGFGWKRTDTTSTHRRVTETSTVQYTLNGWLFCASVEPTTPEEWNAWKAALDPEYDHVSYIYQPREFARALGSMVAEQLGARGSVEPLTNRLPGVPSFQTRHKTQNVFHGPVVYVDDVGSWLSEAASEHDFVLRAAFAKSITHQAQREYRFVVWSEVEPKCGQLQLQASPALVSTMRRDERLGAPHVPAMEPVEDGSAVQDTSPSLNPLDELRWKSDLVEKMREQETQPGAITRPHKLDFDSPPGDFHTRTATYEGVMALQSALARLHEARGESVERKNAAAAAAWFAEQDIRELCAAFDDPIDGISISEDGFIVIHVVFPTRPELECRLAVAPSGHATLEMTTVGRQMVQQKLSPFFSRIPGAGGVAGFVLQNL